METFLLFFPNLAIDGVLRTSNEKEERMHTLRELLRGAQEGDAIAIETLVSRFSGLIQRECAKYGIWQHPDWSHSDLLQEIIFRVWTKIGQFKGTEHEQASAMFDQWVRTTAQSVLKNLHRSRTAKKRKPEGQIKSIDEATQNFIGQRHAQTASSIFATKEEVGRLNVAMDKCLDVECQEILNLRVVEGLSLKEIFQRLSMTYELVRYKFKTSLETLEKGLRSSIDPGI